MNKLKINRSEIKAPAPKAEHQGAGARIDDTKGQQHPRTKKTVLKVLSYTTAIISGLLLLSNQVYKISSRIPILKIKAYESGTLHDGDEVYQVFNCKVPIEGYSPGNNLVFEVLGLHWPRYFAYPAVFKNGFVYSKLGVGRPEDIGKTYQITGKILPPGMNVPFETPLDTPVPGQTFFGPVKVIRK